MSSQNLISAVLTNETKGAILKDLADAQSKLDFLLALLPGDVQSIFKPGAGYLPFMDLSDNVVDQHPEILLSTINIEEFRKDIALARQLAPIILAVDALAEGLHRTYTAVCSDAMSTSFDIYSLVKINRDKIPGMSAIADQMGAYFKKSSRKNASTAEPPAK